MKAAVVVFPGSNCDRDCAFALERVGVKPVLIWHRDTDLKGADAVFLPGGFSYGDYLRTGAIARFSPIMTEVIRFAKEGGAVLGICNGFQILLEAGLLPGAMLRNRSLRFICRPVRVRVERVDTPFTAACDPGQVLILPIAHGEGNYFADPDTLRTLQERGQIVMRYCREDGTQAEEYSDLYNPNGSIAGIAAICNETRNVVGMMPHPERAADPLLGLTDGLCILRSMLRPARNRTAPRSGVGRAEGEQDRRAEGEQDQCP